MIKKYNTFINEGVRDKMTPKSKEEIMSHLGNLPPYDKIKIGTLQEIPEILEQGFKELGKDLDPSKVTIYLDHITHNPNVDVMRIYLENLDIKYFSLDSYLLTTIQKYQNLELVKLFHKYGADLNYLMNFTKILDRYIISTNDKIELIEYLMENSLRIKSYIIERYNYYNKLSKSYGKYVNS